MDAAILRCVCLKIIQQNIIPCTIHDAYLIGPHQVEPLLETIQIEFYDTISHGKESILKTYQQVYEKYSAVDKHPVLVQLKVKNFLFTNKYTLGIFVNF